MIKNKRLTYFASAGVALLLLGAVAAVSFGVASPSLALAKKNMTVPGNVSQQRTLHTFPRHSTMTIMAPSIIMTHCSRLLPGQLRCPLLNHQ